MELHLKLENINLSTNKLKKLSNTKQKLQNKPWITKEIPKSIKNKYKQYQKNTELNTLFRSAVQWLLRRT